MMQTQAAADPDNLAAAVRTMLHAGRPAAARPLLAALTRLRPNADGIALLESGLAEAEGRIPEAIAVLNAALAAVPADAALLKRRAGLSHQAGDTVAALRDAAEAVIAAPADPSAKALLGLLLIETGDAVGARACLAEAIEAEPDNASFRLGFAEAATRTGDAASAAAALDDGIRRTPMRPDLREAAIRLALRRGDPATAERLAEAARQAGLADATVLRLLGRAVAAQGRASDSMAALGEALKLDPQDALLRHMAAAAGMLPAPDRAPPSAVRALFELNVTKGENEVIAAGDRVPGLVRAAVLAGTVFPKDSRLGPVLDLGCGGGLLAVALSDLPLGPFVGVDLSPAMLAAAGQWKVYDELVEADLLSFVAEEQRLFPLILAANVLCWFGSLDPVVTAIAARLAPGGRLILSLEAMRSERPDGRGWELGPEGRYTHTAAACERAARAARIRVAQLAPEILSTGKGPPVPGLIAVLVRSDDAG